MLDLPVPTVASRDSAPWLALLVAVLALSAYLRTLCPTIFAGDSGELAAAAVTLGIAHPPGYPLWVLLAHGLTFLSPHEPALALNVFSAVCGAIAAAMLTSLLLRIRVSPLAAVAGGLGYAFAIGPWSQSVITEVYALNMALTALSLWAAVAGLQGKRWGYPLAALLLGLGMGNHPLVALAGLPLLAWWAHTRHERPRDAPLLVPLLLFFLGLSVYLYLPLRQSQNPTIEWGGMKDLGDVLRHVLRSQYTGPSAAAGVGSLGTRLRVFFQLFAEDVPPLVWVFAVASALALRHAARRVVTLGSWSLWLLSGPVLAASIGFADTFRDRTVVRVYFLTAVFSAYLLAGIGFSEILAIVLSKLPTRARLLKSVAAALLAAVVLWQGWSNFPVCNRRHSTLARDYADAVLLALPEGARLFANGGDAEVFSLIYEHVAKGVRPDLTLYDTFLNLTVENYGQDFLTLNRSQRKAERINREIQFALDEPKRTIFYTERTPTKGFAGCTLVPNQMIFQLLRPGEKPAEISAEVEPMPPVDSGDCIESVLAASIQYQSGLSAEARGARNRAKEYFERALTYGKNATGIQVVVGEAFARNGDEKSAWECYRRALAIDPRDPAALYAVAVLQMANGHEADALRTLKEMDRLAVRAPEVYMQYGTLLALKGEFEPAIRAATRALSLDPSLESAKTLLGLAREGEGLGGQKGVDAIRERVQRLRVDSTLHAARLQLERGEYQRARDLFETALRAAPSDSHVLYGLGYALLEDQRFEEAAQAFRRMLELDPESVSGINALAYTDAIMGKNLERARQSVLSVLTNSKDLHPYLLDTLGWILQREGKPHEALPYLKDAEEKLPQTDRSMRAENRFHLAAVLEDLGQDAASRSYAAQALVESSDQFWVPELKALQKRLGS